MPKTKANKVLKQDKITVLEWHSRGRRFDPVQLHQHLVSIRVGKSDKFKSCVPFV